MAAESSTRNFREILSRTDRRTEAIGGAGGAASALRLAESDRDGTRAGELYSLGGARGARLVREVASQLVEQADEIASTMVRPYEVEIPAYASVRDPALKDDVHAVSSAMVRCWLTVMSTGESVTPETRRAGAV